MVNKAGGRWGQETEALIALFIGAVDANGHVAREELSRVRLFVVRTAVI
jgi:hypothetical protein